MFQVQVKLLFHAGKSNLHSAAVLVKDTVITNALYIGRSLYPDASPNLLAYIFIRHIFISLDYYQYRKINHPHRWWNQTRIRTPFLKA